MLHPQPLYRMSVSHAKLMPIHSFRETGLIEPQDRKTHVTCHNKCIWSLQLQSTSLDRPAAAKDATKGMRHGADKCQLWPVTSLLGNGAIPPMSFGSISRAVYSMVFTSWLALRIIFSLCGQSDWNLIFLPLSA